MLAHGPTFMGNPLAAAVANASIELLLGQDWRARVKRIETGLRGRPGARPRTCRACVDVRVLGAIGVVQLDHEVDMAAATRAAVDARACGCARSATWSTRCRRTSATRPTSSASRARHARRGPRWVGRGAAGGTRWD